MEWGRPRADRIDRVQVDVDGQAVAISWASRQLLVDLLRADGFQTEVEAFEDAGTSRPVVLTDIGRAAAASAIIALGDGREVPADLVALRSALAGNE